MNFEIICPNCNEIINKEKLSNNEQNNMKINEYLKEQEKNYKEKLINELKNNLNKENDQKIKLITLEKEKDINNSFSKKIEQLVVDNNKLQEYIKVQNQLITQKLENEFKDKEIDLIKKNEEEKKELWNKINNLEQDKLQLKFIQNKLKGENFEYEIETELRKVFEPEDLITKFTIQDKKADFLQEILENNKIIGAIIYEVKNAEWSNNWEKKLTTDMLKSNVKYGILVATSFNKKYNNIPFRQSTYNSNIYLSNPESFIFLAKIIKKLIKIESKFMNQESQNSNYKEKYLEFKKWKNNQLPKLFIELNSNIEKIANLSNSIIKNANDILKEKIKIYDSLNQEIKINLDYFIN